MKASSRKQRDKVFEISLKFEEACRLIKKIQSDLDGLQKEVDDAIKHTANMSNMLKTLRQQMKGPQE